ncbi:hypothetical protein ATL42_2410 [Sanguibacter antarcticus]|uniref:Nucleotidyltransferase AbiEii toxin of type IV toxin-antitoxin system n=2 Tax=Sanguibacter antarcticus TaxID=372484 RepID=A0A2A9E8E1_9MICO|nr:hypothetical protein ATL42_2410 [Sanguibacter antarcticus]
MPVMTDAQTVGWHAVLDLYDRKPTGWTLVGGQMVHLHCAERGASPTRPTDDIDTVLDVRAEPQVLWNVTSMLAGLGFTSAGESWQGHQQRWVSGEAVIDILIPRHLGERASSRRGVGGGTTLETKAAQQALDRTEDVVVEVAGRTGTVRRPSLLGSLVAKSAAFTIPLDTGRDRHLADLAVLLTLVVPADRLQDATARDLRYLDTALSTLAQTPRILGAVSGADDGLARARLALSRAGSRPTVQQPRADTTSRGGFGQLPGQARNNR